jgi:predicted HicB family RNase H-like nuclease
MTVTSFCFSDWVCANSKFEIKKGASDVDTKTNCEVQVQVPYHLPQKKNTINMEDPTMEDSAETVHRKQMMQYGKALAIQCRKRKKEPKEETQEEMFNRITREVEERNIESAKSAAKTLVEKKHIKTMQAYFSKK